MLLHIFVLYQGSFRKISFHKFFLKVNKQINNNKIKIINII